MIDLSGKTAIITGGSRGIGRACVELFCQSGASVAFTYSISEESAHTMVSRGMEKGHRMLAVKADFLDPAGVEQVIPTVIREFGEPEILVNNVGIWTYGKIDEMDPAVWDQTMQVNLRSVFLLCRSVVPHFKKRKGGRIINISSTAGQRGEAEHSHYAASKGALISFTKSLASELGPFGIRVNCVAPGWVNTEMTQKELNDPVVSKEILKLIPLGYVPGPDEIAGPVLFLASELADHVNGEILNVNGGSVLCG